MYMMNCQIYTNLNDKKLLLSKVSIHDKPEYGIGNIISRVVK